MSVHPSPSPGSSPSHYIDTVSLHRDASNEPSNDSNKDTTKLDIASIQPDAQPLTARNTWVDDGNSQLTSRAKSGNANGNANGTNEMTFVTRMMLPKSTSANLSAPPPLQKGDTDALQLQMYARGSQSMNISLNEDKHNRWSVRFSLPMFIEMFLIHAFGPLAVPWVYYRWGWVCVQNMHIQHLLGFPALFTYIWAAMVTMMVLFVITPQSNVMMSEVVIATLILLARNTIIAAKYAYYAPGQLHDMRTRILTPEEQASQLMLAGWMVPSLKRQSEEIDYALKRTHVDVEHMYLTFHEDDPEAQKLIAQRLHAAFKDMCEIDLATKCNLKKEWIDRIDEAGELHGMVMIKGLLQEAVILHKNDYLFKIAQFLSTIHCLIPSFVRLAEGKPFMGEKAEEIVMAVFAIFVTWLNLFANIMFVLVGVIDFNRRIFLMHQCSSLVIPQYQVTQTRKSKLMPLLDFEKPLNIAHWLDLRMLFKNWGLQFFHRIQIYNSLWAFFIFCFILFLFYQLLFTRTTELTSIILVSFDLIVMVVAMIAMLISAKSLNSIHVEHRRILTRKLNFIQRSISGCMMDTRAGLVCLSPAKIKELSQTRDMLQVALQVIETEDEVTPVKILGFDANNNVLRGVVGVAVSTSVAIIRLLLF